MSISVRWRVKPAMTKVNSRRGRSEILFQIGIILCLTFIACNKSQKKEIANQLFNPKDLIVAEFSSLKNVALKKTAIINDKIDSSFQNKIDWNNEFNFLDEIDLSKAAYKNNLSSDSIIAGDTIKRRIVCEEKKLPFKSAQAVYVNQKLVDLKIEIATDNLIFESKKSIDYKPTIGFSIIGFLNLNKHLNNKTNYNIKGIFLKQ